MNRNSFSNIPTETHIALPLLRRYLADTLPGPERHQVEKHLLDCEMCADILAGMEQNPEAKTNAAVQEINSRVVNVIARKKKTEVLLADNWKSWSIAATVLLILISGAGIMYFNLNNLGTQKADQPIAISVPKPAELPVLKPTDPPVKNQETTTQEKASDAVALTKSPLAIQRSAATSVKPQSEESSVASVPALKDASKADNVMAPEPTSQTVFNPIDSVSTVATGAGLAKGNTSKVARAKLQTETITGTEILSGRVLDANSGEPLPGVTVQVKGTATGTTTDAQGKFSLPLSETQAPVTLVYSFIGYITTEKAITNPRLALANVTLKADTKQLSETVVVGYGSYSPNDITIAVKKAKPEAGMAAFKNYVQQNLKYPANAQTKKIQGRVVVGFTVNLDGSVSDLNIIKSLSPDCDAEAMRLVQEGPSWEPTRFNGKPVVQQVQVAIRFKLPKQK